MQRGRMTGGYTIVETMVFLAVSGFMFVVAAYFISGKQANTQFMQSMNSINTRIQQVINDVSDNNYPNVNLQCSLSGSTPPLSLSYGSNTNYGCVFMGKVIQFGVLGGATNGNMEGYNIYTIAGCQFNPCSTSLADPAAANPPTNFSQAKAQAVDPGNTDTCAGPVNFTSCDRLEWGLRVTAMYDDSNNPPSPSNTNSIGFFGSFAQTNSQGLVSGSQSVDVLNTGHNVNGTPMNINVASSNVDEIGMVSALDNYLETTSPSPITNPYFAICLTDGSGHVGAITIGDGQSSNNSHLSTYMQTGGSQISVLGGKETCIAS